MTRVGGIFLLLVVALSGASSVIATSDDAPTTVQAEALSSTATLVSWVPGPGVPEEYRVYGLDASGTALTLLAVVDGTPGPDYLATVDGGYARYAVAAYSGGSEGRLVFAGEVRGGDCFMVSYDPVGIFYDTGCLPLDSQKFQRVVIWVRV